MNWIHVDKHNPDSLPAPMTDVWVAYIDIDEGPSTDIGFMDNSGAWHLSNLNHEAVIDVSDWSPLLQHPDALGYSEAA